MARLQIGPWVNRNREIGAFVQRAGRQACHAAKLWRWVATNEKRMMVFWRFILCILPLGITPVLALLIAEGYLNFGGGEKDLLLLIPWILWSILYAIIYVAQWIKKAKTSKSIYFAAGGATGLMMLLWIGMYIFSASQLGIKR